MKQKGKRFSSLIRKGNPLRWHLDIVIPNYGGRRHNDGSLSSREEFVLTYMRDLFDAFNEALEDIGGMSRAYKVVGKGKK